jgi:ribosomal protein L5
VTIRSSVVNPKEKGGVKSSILARKSGIKQSVKQSDKSPQGTQGTHTSNKGRKSQGTQETQGIHIEFYKQVKQGLQIISGQPVCESNYRVSRPSLNIRSGKLANYQVTLRGYKMNQFLNRFSKLWYTENIGTQTRYAISKKRSKNQRFYKQLKETSFVSNSSISGVRNSSSIYLNDGSKSLPLKDKKITFGLDKIGDFHCGFSSFFVFPEIEKNSKLQSLVNSGCTITIRTTSKTKSQAKILLSE